LYELEKDEEDWSDRRDDVELNRGIIQRNGANKMSGVVANGLAREKTWKSFFKSGLGRATYVNHI